MTLRQEFDKALAARDFTVAKTMLDAAVPVDTHPVLHFQRSAQIHENLGDVQSAARDYAILLETEPSNAKLWDQAGRFFYRLGENEKAANHIERANEISNGKIGCKKTLIASYRRAGNEAAVDVFTERLMLRDDLTGNDKLILAESLLQSGKRLEDALSYFEAGYDVMPSSDKMDSRYGQFMLKLAHQANKVKKLGLAKQAFKKAFQTNPDDYKQYIHYAQLLAQSGDAVGAKKAMKTADKIAMNAPMDYQTAVKRTQIFEKLGADQDAIAAYNVLLDIAPENAKAWDQAGRFYFRRKMDVEAVSHIEKALELSDGSIGCKKTLIAATRRQGHKKDVDKLIADFKGQADKAPKDYYVLADILAGDPRSFKEAREIFETGLELDDKSANSNKAYAALLNKIAQQASRKGDIDYASEHYEQSLKINPDDYRNTVRYVAFLVKQEQFVRANEVLKAAISLADETDIDHLGYLGVTQLRLGDAKAARETFLLAHENDNRNEEASLMRLADVETALGNHEGAVSYLTQLNALNDNRTANRERRIHVHNILQGKFNDQDKARMATCVNYYQKNLPKLDQEQQRILDEIIDRGICMTDFDSLFGAQHQDLWDEAEKFVQNFVNDPETKALEKRISECDDFNADPEFAGSFKPSIINYRLLKGEMYATEAAYQLYLNKRILDITNSYHEMLSKIRNVALWVNPPIGGKNIGERKGSQIWHRDQEDANILKCFIYYSDIDESSGATEYIPYSKVKPTRKYSDVLAYPNSSGYPGKFLIDTRIDPKDMLKAEGKKKSIMFFDTNGFHRGGYVTGDKRILTMATFLRPITPYADTNTKLSMEGFNEDDYPFEAVYGVKK